MENLSFRVDTLWSCQECQRRKRKCSKEKPSCSLCLKKHTTCVYSAPRKRGPPKGYLVGLRSTGTLENLKRSSLQNTQLLSSSMRKELMNVRLPRSLSPISTPTNILSKIPIQLQMQLLQSFMTSFSCSVPVFHHKYFFYRLSKQVLPDILLYSMFAMASRVFLKKIKSETSNRGIHNKWVKIIQETDLAGTALQLAQQQMFMEPSMYSASALLILSTMMYFDGDEFTASRCFMMVSKISQEMGLPVQDVENDTTIGGPNDTIEKEERRRLFWWVFLMSHCFGDASTKPVLSIDEQKAYVLLPGDDEKWQKMAFQSHEPRSWVDNTLMLPHEDRQMAIFELEIDILLTDIGNVMNSVKDYNTAFNFSDGVNELTSKLLSNVQQLQLRLECWDNRLPSQLRYDLLCVVKVPDSTIHVSTTRVLRWVRVNFLQSKLYLHQIHLTLCLAPLAKDVLRECLEIADELIKLTRSSFDKDLIDDPSIFSYIPRTCDSLLTMINWISDMSFSTSIGSANGIDDREKLLFCHEAKRHIDSTYELTHHFDPIWQNTVKDVFQMIQIKEATEQAYSLAISRITASAVYSSFTPEGNLDASFGSTAITIPFDFGSMYPNSDEVLVEPDLGNIFNFHEL
ncbi:hypothetical protein K7432_012209 [Basidiobolus ranarum]|uniref:Zn(2)-C6 fungal-type domain-containing protein n=1 Tax=Basidiobolus ranarum TaxID=34480 RepID=A0ABR2VSM4_9FUNG